MGSFLAACCVLCGLLIISISATPYSLPLVRTPHRRGVEHVPPFLNKYYDSRNKMVTGNTIKMGGGLLTLGSYTASLTVGNPPQSFNVLVDTGSSHYVRYAVDVDTCTTVQLPGVGCGSCGNSGFSPYNPSLSSSSQGLPFDSPKCSVCSPSGLFDNVTKCAFHQPQQAPDGFCGFGITYGGGSSGTSGSIYTDDACLGKYCVSDFPFDNIQNEFPAGSFSSPAIQGIMGLCYEFNACNPSCTTPILDQIVATYNISNEFAMCITYHDGGVLDIGYVNSTRMTTPFLYTPVTTEHWYNIEPLNMSVGPYSLNVPPFMFVTTNDVIGTFVDSGTGVLLLGPYLYDTLVSTFMLHYKHLPGISGTGSFWDGDCVPQDRITLSDFPSVNITLPLSGSSGISFDVAVTPSAYLLPVGRDYCMGIGTATGVGMVMGDVFMENYYVHFDRQNKQLGFSPLAPGSCVA